MILAVDKTAGFNPLKVGSYCNKEAWEAGKAVYASVSIPLKSGHIVTYSEVEAEIERMLERFQSP